MWPVMNTREQFSLGNICEDDVWQPAAPSVPYYDLNIQSFDSGGIQQDDPNMKRFPCPNCGKCYRSQQKTSLVWSELQQIQPHVRFKYADNTTIGMDVYLNSNGRKDLSRQSFQYERTNQKLFQPSKYKCPNCTRSYKSRQSLWKHKKYECGKQPQFQCLFCGKMSKYKSDLRKHEKSIHGFVRL